MRLDNIRSTFIFMCKGFPYLTSRRQGEGIDDFVMTCDSALATLPKSVKGEVDKAFKMPLQMLLFRKWTAQT